MLIHRSAENLGLGSVKNVNTTRDGCLPPTDTDQMAAMGRAPPACPCTSRPVGAISCFLTRQPRASPSSARPRAIPFVEISIGPTNVGEQNGASGRCQKRMEFDDGQLRRVKQAYLAGAKGRDLGRRRTGCC